MSLESWHYETDIQRQECKKRLEITEGEQDGKKEHEEEQKAEGWRRAGRLRRQRRRTEVSSGGMSSHYCHNCKQMMYSFGFPKTCPKCGKPW